MENKTIISYMILASDGESPMPLKNDKSLNDTKEDLIHYRRKYPLGKFTMWKEEKVISELIF